MQRQSLPVAGAVSQMRSILLMESMSRETFLMVLTLTSWASCCPFIYRACNSLVDQESESICINMRLHDVTGRKFVDDVIWLSKCRKCLELQIYICAAIRLRLVDGRPRPKATAQVRQRTYSWAHSVTSALESLNTWLAELPCRLLQTAKLSCGSRGCTLLYSCLDAFLLGPRK